MFEDSFLPELESYKNAMFDRNKVLEVNFAEMELARVYLARLSTNL